MMYLRNQTKCVKIGGVTMGGSAPVRIQSMLNRPAADIAGNVAQAVALEQAGCEIIRTAVPDKDAVALVSALKKAVKCPIVADIHFDYRLAVESVKAGVDKIRINPGNIGSKEKVKEVVTACKANGVPIRIGVNSGSVEKPILEKYGAPVPEALAESAMGHIRILEDLDFTDIVLSIKSSDPETMYKTNLLIAEQCPYPLHLGVTEAGTQRMGIIRSAAGIGGLLLAGIGNTIRVSLTDDPVAEIAAAKDLLRACGLRKGVHLVSCPTCGRTKIDLIGIANAAEKALENCDKELTVAIMGCVVNGPGEAKEADIGIAGGDGCGILFKKGEIVKKLPEDELLTELLKEIEKM